MNNEYTYCFTMSLTEINISAYFGPIIKKVLNLSINIRMNIYQLLYRKSHTNKCCEKIIFKS